MPELAPEVKAAFDVAYANISAFHEAQVQADVEVETMPGVRCKRVTRPIGAVGLYVPGGSAVLPSTALMLAIPAKIAKCEVGAFFASADGAQAARDTGFVRRTASALAAFALS